MGDTSAVSGKDVLPGCGQPGSHEGSDNGQESSEEAEKCLNGSKESTPDVCPEYERSQSVGESSDDSSATESVEPENVKTVSATLTTNGNGLVRKTDRIERSTDTLVPENENFRQNGVKHIKSLTVPVVNNIEESMWSLHGDAEPLDSDGLLSHHNHLQRRMVQIFSSHHAEVTALRRDLQMSRIALTQAGIKPETILTCAAEEPDHFLDGQSGVESTASEVSWEAVDESDTVRPTLWIPDHAASSCMGCNTQFWFGRRKHHCRSCGRLFCSECSENTVPIPAEQLYNPVRVCDGCFSKLTSGNNIK